MENTEVSQPQIREFRVWNNTNAIFAFLIGILMIMSFPITLVLFSFSISGAVIALLAFSLAYAVILFFLLEPRMVREINYNRVRFIDRPVVQKVFVDRPVVREITVEKQVPVTVYRDVVRPVYLAAKKKKLNIPKYKFVGSTERKVYHAKSCRLGKLIKKKYKVNNNSKAYFKNKRFRACKVCILKQKKI